MQIECRLARRSDFDAIQQMLELYQHDLSEIWIQDLDDSGRYGYDLDRHRRAAGSFAYVVCADAQYAGFALLAPACVTQHDGFWMEQFFVLRRYRRSGLGRQLARHVFARHPGPWEIGEMPGNAAATAFWRRIISQLTGGEYEELEVQSGWWQGTVQRFVARGAV